MTSRLKLALLAIPVVALGLFGTAAAGTSAENCPMHPQVVFWTSTDWELLGEELKAQQSPCADYYISIPPLSNDKTALRAPQDDVIRALGPRFHPLAEVTLGNVTGWASWVTGAPGRTWFDAGVEFRRRMTQAGYRPELGETWLLNELDRSTIRDKPPYTRAAMKDLLRGLYEGDGNGPKLPGVVEVGIAYTHQNIPDVEVYRTELKSWLQDSDFWTSVAPTISMLTKEVYPDARFWGSEYHAEPACAAPHAVHGAPDEPRQRGACEHRRGAVGLHERLHTARQRNMAGTRPGSVHASVLLRPWLDPDAARRDAGVRLRADLLDPTLRGEPRHKSPQDRLGFSWQPTNNFDLPARRVGGRERAIASRIGESIQFGYRAGSSTRSARADRRAARRLVSWGDVGGGRVPGGVATFERW